MAILLTTSYQQIGTIPLNYGEIRFYARYYEQNQVNNYTNFQLKTTYYTYQNTLSFSSATTWLDGTSKNYGYTTFYKGETTLMEENRMQYHNDDGSSITRTVGASWYSSYGGSGETTADIDFPKIDRYPMLTYAPNFSDEDNPTIEYTTTMGFAGGRLYACISVDGSLDDVPYREINVASGSYTFELTQAERNTLRNATPNSNNLNVMFFIRTDASGSSYYSFLTRTMTIVNAEPEISSLTVTETNQDVIDVLGSATSNSVIPGVSSLHAVLVPIAKKGASITKVTLVKGSTITTDTTSPYEFDFSPSSSQTFIVSDSRGNTTGITVNKNVLPYVPISLLNFSFERDNPTSSDIIFNLEASYIQHTYNQTPNVPVVKWKLDDGSFNTIPSTEYTIDTTNNKLIISDYELTNTLVYTSKGTFTISVEDIFTSAIDTQDVLKGIPTFDYGEHDLKVNGDLYIANTDGQNPVNVLENIVPKYIQAYLNTRYTAYITQWQLTPLQLSVAETNDSNMFIFDNANDRITIGSGVNKIEISAVTSWQQASSTGEFDVQITKNGQSLGNEFIVFGSTTTDVNNRTVIPIVINVQQGDYIQVCFTTGISSIEVLTNKIYIKKIN